MEKKWNFSNLIFEMEKTLKDRNDCTKRGTFRNLEYSYLRRKLGSKINKGKPEESL